MIQTKLKAGALQLTLFIVVVIALLLASFLIFVHTYAQFNVQSNFVIETTQNMNKGIQYALFNDVSLNDSTYIDLEDENYKSLKITRSYWGIFEKITSEAKIKNYRLERSALIGATQPKLERMALYLEDSNKPLVVVGNTKIQGMAYLPERGVRTGNISGHSYYGEQLIYGSTKKSGALPKLVSEFETHLKNISTEERINYIDITKSQKFENSFSQPVQVVFSPYEIRLEAISLTGHIIVQSKTSIVVAASANLKDVILIAPKVVIKDRVEGTFQVIATEAITIGNKCHLHYPSALVVYNENPQVSDDQFTSESTNNAITIHSDSKLDGVVLWHTVSKPKNYQPQILIDENVLIRG
ncbi:MAG: hypothetical protein WA749_13270, partial [Gelidibacter sp.]